MPSNRAHVERGAKIEQILDVAEPLFLRDGYKPTTMTAIAGNAGIASNSIYWYFPSKDDLFAAVLQRRLDRALAKLDSDPKAPMLGRAATVFAELDKGAILIAPVHERSKHSRAVARVHQAFHDAVSERISTALEAFGLSARDARMAAATIVAVIEGIHLHDPVRDPRARSEILEWLLARLIAPPPPV